jgi:hypothetical protein
MGSPNIGDRLTDWSQGITFIVATLGYHAGVPLVACSTTGEIHRLQDCGEPDIRYERALTEEELATAGPPEPAAKKATMGASFSR